MAGKHLFVCQGGKGLVSRNVKPRMFGLGTGPKEIFFAYSTLFVFLTINLVPGNVVMVGIDMCGKSPITGEWIYGIMNSFRHRHHKQDTELSKHIWKLQDKGINFNVKWSVAAYASTYRCGSRRCDLCLTEKYVTARANHKNLLNKRTELISKCRHRNKYILKNIK